MTSILAPLLAAGARAPSYNNRQPWRVQVERDDDDGGAFVVAVDAAELPTYDAVGLTGRLAVAMFLVNVEIAAAAAGLDVSVAIDADLASARVVVSRGAYDDGPDHAADDAADEEAAGLLGLLMARETNRTWDASAPLDDDDKEALRSAGAGEPGTSLTLIEDLGVRDRLARILSRGAAVIPYNRALHGEALSGTRLTRHEARSSRDGVDVATLQASPRAAELLAVSRDFDRLLASNTRDVAHTTNVLAFEMSAAVAVLHVAGPLDAAAMFAAGRALQQVWLQASALGLGFQPATALTLLLAQPRAHLARLISADDLAALDELEPALRSELETPAGAVPVFALRLHRATRPWARSLRRPLAGFVRGPLRPTTTAARPPLTPLLVVRTADVKGQVDVEGRPLGEQAAPDDTRAGAATEHRSCPYPGIRHQHVRPMNVSALRQMTDHWQDVLAALAFSRRAACDLAALSAPPTTTTTTTTTATATATASAATSAVRWRDLWRAGQIGSLWASLHVHTADVAGAPLPVLPALSYKVLIGINAVVQALHFEEKLAELSPADDDGGGHADDHDHDDHDDDARVVSARRVHAAAEARGVLVGPREVCAGPPGLIDQALQVFVEGRGAPADFEARVAPLVADEARLVRFAQAHMDFALGRFLYLAGRAAIASDLQAWAQIPGGLDSLPDAAALAARIDAVVEACGQERIGSVMPALDAEDRETLVAHFAADLAETSLAVGFVSPWRRPDARVYEDVRRVASGGPGTRELVLALTRALLLERALLRVVADVEGRLAAILDGHMAGDPRGPRDVIVDDRALGALAPDDLARLVRDLAEADIDVDVDAIVLRER